jgi:hypothetical protein
MLLAAPPPKVTDMTNPTTLVDLSGLRQLKQRRSAAVYKGLQRIGAMDLAMKPLDSVVNPGDLVLGKADGVSVVPAGRSHEAVEEATSCPDKEVAMCQAMSRGAIYADLPGTAFTTHGGSDSGKLKGTAV